MEENHRFSMGTDLSCFTQGSNILFLDIFNCFFDVINLMKDGIDEMKTNRLFRYFDTDVMDTTILVLLQEVFNRTVFTEWMQKLRKDLFVFK